MSIFEAGMMVCFGASWSIAAYKTYKAKCVDGKSLRFSSLILLGYVFGIIHKILYSQDLVIILGLIYALEIIVTERIVVILTMMVREDMNVTLNIRVHCL